MDSEIIDQRIANGIREIREDLHITQSEMAEYLGVSRQQIAKYEKGKSRISAGKLFVLCKELGTTPDVLFHTLMVKKIAESFIG